MNLKRFQNPFGVTAFGVCLFFLFWRMPWIGQMVWRAVLILSPFLLGLCFAFALDVPMRFFERTLFRFLDRCPRLAFLKRVLALLLTVLVILSVLFVLFRLLLPQLYAALELAIEHLPGMVRQADAWLKARGYDVGQWLFGTSDGLAPNAEEIRAQMQNALRIVWQGALLSSGLITGIFSNMLTVFFTFMFTLYSLFSKEKLCRQARRVLQAYAPAPVAERTLDVVRMANKTFSSFVAGQCLEACILGAMFFVSMLIFRMPNAALISMLVAVCALIPLIGAWIACILGALLLMTTSPVLSLWFILLFLVLQQIEGNLVYPHVMSGAVGLPSLWVLLAIVVGDGLYGILGMLLAIPTTSLLYALFSEQLRQRERKRRAPSA